MKHARRITGRIVNPRIAHAPGAVGARIELPTLKPLRVLVAGEVILDRYVMGDVSRVSPEAPIPILQVSRIEERPGNAGFVMANLRALGAQVSALSVVGADRNGALLREMFGDLGIDTRSVLVDPDRPTIVKERMLGSVQSANRATQQLLRVDQEAPHALGPAKEHALMRHLERELGRVDGVLISDINKGLLTPRLLRRLIDGARRRKIPVIVDPRLSEDFSIYRGATALTPNRYETEFATGARLVDRDAWMRAADELVGRLKLDACLVTLDRDGMYLSERRGPHTYIPTTPRAVYDVTGAGDVVLAVFGLFAIAGLGFASAARLANLAAGIEVSRLGTEIISREDLARALNPGPESAQRKIVSVQELRPALARQRGAGRRVVFTNGCFDLLHAGHIEMLSFARAQGDMLVVGVNSDRSVRLIKGSERPIYPAAERALILAALEVVDHVVVFDETRAARIVRAVRPDVLVKGEDWRDKTVDGQLFVESYGGRVALAPLLPGYGTTLTLERLHAAPARRAGAELALKGTQAKPRGKIVGRALKLR
ncbi:MAG TPA: bifunctional heptose 7-phosphate kinase/heptose 1-phosphate adenyltransferase [Candidatus Binataceae bacterium]|nr:bifunctional heptose 7-phosphate kinase/heptose 1-phosphate adenyltransferase [Candidatus Binataceae bacterium]